LIWKGAVTEAVLAPARAVTTPASVAPLTVSIVG